MRASLPKYLPFVLISFVGINGIFFLLRNNVKFAYTLHSSIAQLYPAEPAAGDINKWTDYNNKYTAEEIRVGTDIINSRLRIDTILGEYEKAIAIGKWLKKSFSKQEGYPSATLGNLSPLHQYILLINKKNEKLWCSHYQAMFGFYCTLAGIKNRYVEVVPIEGAQKAGYHEVNEIYLTASQSWVMIDVTRNILSVKQQQKLLTAAGYYRQLINGKMDTLAYLQYNNITKSLADSQAVATGDVYFNQYYALRYYYTMDLGTVYSVKNKVKRYFFGNPWFEIYDPVRKHSNFLFRIRQTAAVLLLASVLLAGYFFLATRRSDNTYLHIS
jgi:hypothetical protein